MNYNLIELEAEVNEIIQNARAACRAGEITAQECMEICVRAQKDLLLAEEA